MTAKTQVFVCPDAFVERESPPTSYAIAALLNGEPDGPFRLVKGILQRTIFIAPGLWVSGIREPKQLLLSTIVTSTSVSLFLIAFFALQRQGVIDFDSRTGKFGRTMRPAQRFRLPAAG